MDGPGHLADDLGRPPGTLGGHPADHPGHDLLGMARVARIDPLRADCDEDVAPDLEAPRGERRGQHRPGRADVGGAGQDDRLADHRVLDDRAAGGFEDAQVGHEVVIDRRRHADHDRPRTRQQRRVGRQLEALATQEIAQPAGILRDEIHALCANGPEAFLADVDSEDILATLDEGQGAGQANIAKTKDRDRAAGRGPHDRFDLVDLTGIEIMDLYSRGESPRSEGISQSRLPRRRRRPWTYKVPPLSVVARPESAINALRSRSSTVGSPDIRRCCQMRPASRGKKGSVLVPTYRDKTQTNGSPRTGRETGDLTHRAGGVAAGRRG